MKNKKKLQVIDFGKETLFYILYPKAWGHMEGAYIFTCDDKLWRVRGIGLDAFTKMHSWQP